MFSLLNARLLSRLGTVVGPSIAARQLLSPPPISRVVLGATTRRTFLTSARLFLPAAAKPAKKTVAKKTGKKTVKPAVKKATPKKKAVPKKAAPKKKVAAKKKKPAPKKKVVKKKVVKKKVAPKPPRITKAMGPPKRGLSAYTVFAQELLNTSTFMKDGAPKERIAACGPAWKALSDAEKQPYYAKALVSREQAADAYNEYMAGVDPKLLFQINKQRKAKKLPLYRNHLAPKRPRSSFFRFMDEFRKATPPNSVTEIAKLGGEAWKALSVSDKERYAREYKGEMTTWRLEHPSPAMTKAASATA